MLLLRSGLTVEDFERTIDSSSRLRYNMSFNIPVLTFIRALTTRSMGLMLIATALNAGQLVSVGDHGLYIDCSGHGFGPTVILEAGAGASSSNFDKVQSRVEKFARVCSYDRAGLGKSGQTPTQQTEVGLLRTSIICSSKPMSVALTF
jgi:hypothetical protein